MLKITVRKTDCRQAIFYGGLFTNSPFKRLAASWERDEWIKAVGMIKTSTRQHWRNIEKCNYKTKN